MAQHLTRVFGSLRGRGASAADKGWRSLWTARESLGPALAGSRVPTTALFRGRSPTFSCQHGAGRRGLEYTRIVATTRTFASKVENVVESCDDRAAAELARACDKRDKTMKLLLSSIDYIGTVLFAFTGTLKAGTIGGMDLLGCVAIGFTTAVGGGTVRDFLLGNAPVFWMKQYQYIVLAVGSALATFFLYPEFRSSMSKGLDLDPLETEVLNWADAIALGSFACVGAMSAVKKGKHPLVVCVCGMVTATFGGIIRDLCCQQKPWVFHTDSGLYASTALGGAISFVITTHLARLPVFAGILSCVSTCVAMRYASWRYGVALPKMKQPSPAAD